MLNFSVIIPTCNRHQQLAQAIHSLKDQNPDLIQELIIVEDGDARPIVNDVSGLALKTLRTGSRSGPGAARNRGARSAEAELLLFMDDDITLPSGSLEEIAAHYKSQNRQPTAIAGRVLPSSDLTANCYIRFAYSGIAHSIGNIRGRKTYMHFCSSFLAVEKSTFLQIGGFNEDLFRYEDADLGFRLQERGTQLLLPQSPRAFHGKQMDRDWFINRCEFTGQYLRQLHRLHPGAARTHHKLFYKRVFAWLSDHATRAALRHLNIVESLPDGLARFTLKVIHTLAMLSGYVYGERDYR